HDAARERALAAARLAHHTQGLSLLQREGDVVDSMNHRDRAIDQHPLLDREVQLNVLYLDQRLLPVDLRRLLDGCLGAHAATERWARPMRPSTSRRVRLSETSSQHRS